MKLRESSKVVKFNWRNFIWISAVHGIALSLCWYFFTWQAFVVFVVFHYLTGMVGITFGFHRLIAHKGFQASKPLEYFAAFCGTLSCQGGPISWVGQHRVHHAYSDKAEDPHDMNKGFWHSHIGFIFNRRADLNDIKEVSHYCPDVARNKYYQFLENYMIPIQFAVGILLFILGGFISTYSSATFDWFNAVSFIVWGIFVRLVAGYHVTWFVNSATHKWGSRPNNTNDASRNNWWVGILAFGEGWHNNHHAQPRAARHGWKWWQFDQTWIMISLLNKFKLVKNIKLPVQSIDCQIESVKNRSLESDNIIKVNNVQQNKAV
ncbi:fatty acid desaturase [Pigmentibacter sp. JX0631]|uniref:acyl-CoA desaturase n=1 Tax=Pigmentibacter sp. JX0631 TaxID=2976982 RepID=UPI0024682F89|nr:fatty acid desaturase [Pigmentibacter sp. JX0631]WGL58523.1 fatty acid desaturase [Pigmentibacter sp. JX0631]